MSQFWKIYAQNTPPMSSWDILTDKKSWKILLFPMISLKILQFYINLIAWNELISKDTKTLKIDQSVTEKTLFSAQNCQFDSSY